MNENIKLSQQISPGDYRDLFNYLLKDLQLIKKKFFGFSLKHVDTDESQQYGIRYFEMQYQQQILEPFANDEFEKIIALPVGEHSRCATQFSCRYTKSGNVVGFQVQEVRPEESFRYFGLTPAKVFLNEEGARYLETAKKVDQPID